MLDFRPAKTATSGTPRFTLDPVEREKARQGVSKRRVWHLISVLGAMLILGWMFYNMLSSLRGALTPVNDSIKHELTAAAMHRPSIADLPPLPEQSRIDEQNATAHELLKAGTVPLWIDQPDAGTLAWIIAQAQQDAAAPPMPQRVSADDLILGHVRAGATVLLSGVLEDNIPAPVAGGDQVWQRMLVRIAKDEYVELFAPSSAAALPVGNSVQVIGRYLGPGILPPDKDDAPKPAPGAAAVLTRELGNRVQLPVVAARVVAPVSVQAAVESPWKLSPGWQMPDDIYKYINDELLILETRPYYYTLAEVDQDRKTPQLFAHAPDGNKIANEIHKRPADFRGQPFTIHGHVFHAWQDSEVDQDQPFGVKRVVRVIMWSEDWGPFDEQDLTGKVTTKNKLVQRVFELAAITDQAIPKDGDVLTATGRFLRFRALEVKPGTGREHKSLSGQSNRAYTFFFVTNGFTVMPPPETPDWTILSIITFGMLLVVGGLLLFMARKESQRGDPVFDSVRRLRQSRRRLKAAPVATPPVVAASAEGPAALESAPAPPPTPEDHPRAGA